jgi:GNAT superfamily N-acetyltransferase
MNKLNQQVMVTLKDGTDVLLRPVNSEDKERIVNGMRQLSAESRYFRFYTSIAKLSQDQLEYFTEVDDVNHVAWIAVDPATPAQRGLGIARFIRYRNNPRVAEMAFTVIDNWQHFGLGTYLVGVLYLMAQARGVEVLRAIALPENKTATDFIQKLGGKTEFAYDCDQTDLRVARELSLLADSAETERFRRVLAELQLKFQK